MKKKLAVIPARGGSKRLPKKNIMDFCGKPMIAWTIEAALKSGVFTDVLVSTDCEETANISREFGASVPFLRNSKTSDDITPVHLATLAALEEMEKFKSYKYETVIQLMANCPCKTSEDIIKAYDKYKDSDFSFQLSVFKFGWMNPWWAMEVDKDNMKPRPKFPEALKERSQDLKELYCPTGAIWIANVNAFKKAKTFYGPDYRVFEIPWESAVDIDGEDDFRMARSVFNSRFK